MTTAPTAERSPFHIAAGVGGAIGGWALSRYCGVMLFIPLAAAGLLGLLFTKTPIGPRYFRGAVCVTLGHFVWFAVGSALLHNLAAVALDLVVLSVAVILLWARPGRAAAMFLVFEVNQAASGGAMDA